MGIDSKHRVKIPISEEDRKKVREMLEEMHHYYERGYTPRAKKRKACYVCSLKDLCLPELETTGNVEGYISKALAEISGDNE